MINILISNSSKSGDFAQRGFLNLIIPNNKFIFIYLIVIAFFNYYFFIKGNKFLKYNFKKDKKGGVIAVLIILVIFATFVAITFVNRNLRIEKKINNISNVPN